MSELVRFGVAIEDVLLGAFDEHLERRGYGNRSEALRDLIRAALQREAWDRGADIVVTISMIYDHHVRDLADALIEIQHDHTDRIIATTHVHLDHHHCLEVILAKGPSNELKRLADKLIGTKGVVAGDVSGLAIVGAREAKKPRAGAKSAKPSKAAKKAKKPHVHPHPHE